MLFVPCSLSYSYHSHLGLFAKFVYASGQCYPLAQAVPFREKVIVVVYQASVYFYYVCTPAVIFLNSTCI